MWYITISLKKTRVINYTIFNDNGKDKSSRFRLFDVAWCFLLCSLRIMHDTIADNVTAPATDPNTMTPVATLLKLGDEEVCITANQNEK